MPQLVNNNQKYILYLRYANENQCNEARNETQCFANFSDAN